MAEWENKVRKAVPYTPGEQPKENDIIKLNTNENPYPPSPAVKEALEELNYKDMRLYPAPDAAELVNAIAGEYGVKPEEVFVGVGSDDVLSVAFQTFFNSDEPILFPEITYSFYDVWADVYKIPYEAIPLNDDLTIDPEDYTLDNGGIVIANPNAPTGIYMRPEAIEGIVKANPGSVVIIDEAYIDFGGISVLPLIKKYDNLLVVQTFSKSRSMAGMRIGFAVGNAALIKYMNDVKFSVNSYTMSRAAIAAGTAAAKDTAYYKGTCAKIIKTRERAKNQLTRLGFTFPDSQSNFLFIKHDTVEAKTIFEELRKRKIYVRYWDSKPVLRDHLRVTVGTSTDMQKLFDALAEILK